MRKIIYFSIFIFKQFNSYKLNSDLFYNFHQIHKTVRLCIRAINNRYKSCILKNYYYFYSKYLNQVNQYYLAYIFYKNKINEIPGYSKLY